MASDILPNGIDYQAVLADLRDKRSKLDAAISGIETMLGIGSMSGTVEIKIGTSATLNGGDFLGMTVVDATVKYLKIKRSNQTTEDILAALKEGGLAFTSENPINTVGSTLHRNWNQGGEVVRVDRGVWGLAEWHPRLKKRPSDKNSNDQESSANNEETTGEDLV